MLFRQTLPELQGKIRVINALKDPRKIDIYLGERKIGEDLSFSEVSCYETIPADSYDLNIYESGKKEVPLLSKKVNILPSNYLTISIVDMNKNYDILILNDANSKEKITNTFLRFINLSENAPLMTLSLFNDIKLFDNVEYLESTGYYPLSPAIYNFRLSFSSLTGLYKNISDKKLVNGKFHTIYIIGLLNNEPQIGYLLLQDG